MASLYLLESSGFQSGFSQYLEFVEPERRKELSQSGPTRTALCRLGAGLLVHTVLNRFWGHFGIQRTKEGQPFLPGAPFFSLSHSGSYILLGVSDSQIGVDIQEHRPVHAQRLADRFFHPFEAEKIRISSDPNSMFFQIWSAKESYVKAKGRGFSLSFSSFCLLPESSGNCTISIPPASPCRIHAVSVPSGYTGAVCSTDPNLPEHPILCTYSPRHMFGIQVPEA